MRRDPSPMAGTANDGWSAQRHGWILASFVAFFLTLSAALLYKQHFLVSDWPFDQAYMIQQFHNWRSGYPKVTIQPGDLRSGMPGQKPFEETHTKLIYAVFKAAYWAWPYPETLIVLYAFFVSLSVVSLYLFLNQLSLGPAKVFWLVSCWMFYPLQQKVAAYTYCDPLSMTATFYFFYLYLLCRDSRYSILGCLGLLLPREEAALLIIPTLLLLPRKWKTLLWHLACMTPFLLFAKSGTGDPFAYARSSFDPSFLWNFPLTQTALWVLALVHPAALLIAAAFMLSAILVGGEIYFRFPGEYLGTGFIPAGGFYYYGLFLAPIMAAVAIGISRLKPKENWRFSLSVALLLIPGIMYSFCQLRNLCAAMTQEARQIQAFKGAHAPPDAAVVTDYTLSAAFANRNQIYVYQQPPKDMFGPEMFARSDVAVLRSADAPRIEAVYFHPSVEQGWKLLMKTSHYWFYKKTR